MKYLDYPQLSQLSSSLSNNPAPDVKLKVRIEAYSVKPIGKERKMFKEMEEAYVSEQEEMAEMSFSPEMKAAGLSSCFGRLDEKESRKVHWLLVSTLNSAFPDNDYTSLRPDQFTREPSAVDAINHINNQLIGPTTQGAPPITVSSPPQHSSSPLSTSPLPGHANIGMYHILNDVVSCEECEVYSWFPEPEYDPHVQSDDNDESDDGLEELLEEQDEHIETMADGMDVDEPAWGQAGLELEGAPVDRLTHPSGARKETSEPMAPPMEHVNSSDRFRSLLWSANYFFYNRRQKRVLYLTCWCRKRPSTVSPPLDADTSSFPLPLAASYSGPSPMVNDLKPPRKPRQMHARPTQRRSRPNLRNDFSSTIPIRQPETPRPGRLASSAPSTYSPLSIAQSPSAAFAKMNAGGFRPRQTPARSLINAAKEAKEAEEAAAARARVRKERSGSTTPGPSTGSALSDKIKDLADVSKGKRLRV